EMDAVAKETPADRVGRVAASEAGVGEARVEGTIGVETHEGAAGLAAHCGKASGDPEFAVGHLMNGAHVGHGGGGEFGVDRPVVQEATHETVVVGGDHRAVGAQMQGGGANSMEAGGGGVGGEVRVLCSVL